MAANTEQPATVVVDGYTFERPFRADRRYVQFGLTVGAWAAHATKPDGRGILTTPDKRVLAAFGIEDAPILADTTTLLTDGAVLTKRGSVVNLELDGETGLSFMSKPVHGPTDTDRAEFDSKAERDAALIRTVGLYEADGWTRAEG